MSLAGAWHFAAVVHQFLREEQAAQGRAEACIALSSEQGFQFFWAMGTIDRGRVLAEQGQREEGIAQIRQGLAAYQATGAELWRPYFLTLLAEAYGKVRQAEEGLSKLAEALDVVDKTGERYYEAELYRLKGELTLAQSSVQRLESRVQSPHSAFPNPHLEAETCFLKAIEIAQHQRAKSLELRAVMSLVRLRQQQATQYASRNTHHVTRTLLSEIYPWFTEGFDTKDLREAKALLDELS